jgi:hypothetical protein
MHMSECCVIDAFPAFLEFWPTVRHEPVDAQVDAWASVYMARWPELLAKQQSDYAGEGEDWRQIARERVFPHLDQRLPGMSEAHKHLLDVCEPVYAQAREELDFDGDAIFVVYVGIGCGAGWVTTYQGLPAVLFGLENVVEEGWTQPSVLSGLVAHEVGHLAHFHWRGQSGLPKGSGPWWQLYAEGFAQRFEHRIHRQDTWHMAHAVDGWLDWCQAHRGWLASEFLGKVDRGVPVRPFFGSWFELRGWKQTGYYLGHEVIRRLEKSLALEEIALLNDLEITMRHELEVLAGLR